MKTPIFFPVLFRLKNQERIMLWTDGGPKPAYFFSLPRASAPVVAKSIDELKKITKEQGLSINPVDPYEIDIDTVLKAVKSISKNQHISSSDANLLISFWNVSDDLQNTFRLISGYDLKKIDASDNLYEKLFRSNNLPSLESSTEEYRATIGMSEKKELLLMVNDFVEFISSRVFK